MNRFFFLLFTTLLILHLNCCQTPQRSVTPAFYHWQTTLNIGSEAGDYLDSIGCKKLYIKILDVGVNEISGAIEPYSRLEITDTTGLQKWEIIPTVFITNAVFKNISPEKTEWLVGKITETIKASPLRPFQELQFDCDWTASTRQAFFLFLRNMKKALPDTRLSATIRLHQYKFPEKTGVPPVSRGMLMFYNTGDIESETTGNSIIDPKDAEKYVRGAAVHYPIPLDLALPVFSWTLIYREGAFWKIINGVPADVQDTARFEVRAGKATHFQVKKATFLSGHYLRVGDRLRVETVSPGLLLAAAQLAAQVDLDENATVAFFHLDSTSIRHYSPQLIDSVCQKIRFPEKK